MQPVVLERLDSTPYVTHARARALDQQTVGGPAPHPSGRHYRDSREQVDATWRAEGGAPSFAALQECDLLLGCIYEALRLFPTVPMTAKILDADREVAGVRLRKGTAVAANKAGVAAMPSCFPEPDKFDPSRFRRNEHGKHGANMHAFGGGPRACVGRQMATTICVAALAEMLRAASAAEAEGEV